MTRIRFTVAILLLTAGLVAAAPKSYPFAVGPEKAFDALSKLDRLAGQRMAPTADQAALFADAADGKLEKVSFAEACLIASGVADADARKTYLARIDAIEADARKAIEGAKSPAEKGEKLLKFLHAGPMAKGYESKQTDLHLILDTGTFNCVSSAVLYNVIGRRLGLDLRAVEIPQHVFAVLYDGDTKYDVETTNARGFDPSDDNGGAKKVTKKERHGSSRREVGEAGLAAIIFYNHGVSLTDEKKHAEAIRVNFQALGLDRTSPSAAGNALAGLTNWPLELSKAGKFEDALTVIAVSLELAPKHSGLENNHKAIWSEYAESLAKVGKMDEALAVLRRAAKAAPEGDFERRQAFLFLKPGQEKVEAKQWEDALKVYEAGLAKVDAKAKRVLLDARAGLFFEWAQSFEQAGEFEKALEVLRRGSKADPKDGRFKQNTVAVYDAWANKHMEKKDWAGAIKVYETGLKELPNDGHLKNNLAYCKQEMGR
jgi:tetratricopeptide (TPR) repeat protein